MDLNFSGVDRPSFDPIPESDYDLIVSDFVLKPSKADANNIVAHIVFEVEGGEYDGRKVFHYQGLTGESLPFAKVMFEALYGTELDGDFSVDEEIIVGLRCSAHITQRADNRDANKMQNRISFFHLPFETEA